MSRTKPKPKGGSKAKHVSFATLRQQHAKNKSLDIAVASKRLRAKIRGAYEKNDVITKYVDRHGKSNRDGNRYGDATVAEAKEILSL